MKKSKASHAFLIAGLVIMVFAVSPVLSHSRTATLSVSIVNNSSREIRNVYTSHVGSDDWSANQLGDQTIPAGQSANLSNVACDSQQIRVIAEDQDGCFLYTVVDCGDSATWTITNASARDCGN